jgi:hypothetical protein
MDPNQKLGNIGDAAVDKEMYQPLVRRLIYLSHTILDIAYVVIWLVCSCTARNRFIYRQLIKLCSISREL